MEIGEKRARNHYSSACRPPQRMQKSGRSIFPFFRNLSLREIGGGSVGTTQGKKIFSDRLRRQDVVPNLASRRILKEEVEVEGRHGKFFFARHGVVFGCAKTCWGVQAKNSRKYFVHKINGENLYYLICLFYVCANWERNKTSEKFLLLFLLPSLVTRWLGNDTMQARETEEEGGVEISITRSGCVGNRFRNSEKRNGYGTPNAAPRFP